MAWEEAQYVVDEVLSGIQTSQITGIPPKNVSNFSASAEDGRAIIKCTPPSDTIIEKQLVCTVAGVRVIRKTGSAPISPEDGTLIVNVPRGQTISKTDTGLTNGVTYYYGFFPYSDHGVFNINQANVRSVIPSTVKIWAFDQNFADKNPATTISYPTGFRNTYYDKMHTNEGTGPVTPGSWLDFLQNTLKNYPYMVNVNGEMAYPLDPNDYTKKMDGTDSDYNNLNFKGGAFAWLNKIYMREDYSSNGESREVQFSDKATDGFYPVGFYYPQTNTEINGLWLPMGYMDAEGRTLITGTTPLNSLTLTQEIQLLKKYGIVAQYLGGTIINVLRDLEYMLFKSTDIQSAAGYGRCNGGARNIIANQVVSNGIVPGWKGTSDRQSLNKYFHSQVLGSYQLWLRDPYTLLKDGILITSNNYTYDPNGKNMINTKISYPRAIRWHSSHLIKPGNGVCSVLKPENTGSTSTGLCDAFHAEPNGTRINLVLGSTAEDMDDGPGSFALSNEASFSGWNTGAAEIFIPPIGYSPEIL